MCVKGSELITVLTVTQRKTAHLSWRWVGFLFRAFELPVQHENASGRDKVHSLQPQGRAATLVCYAMGFLLFPCLTLRMGVHSKEAKENNERKGSIPLIDGFHMAQKRVYKHCFPLAASPEWGTKTSDLSESVVAAFCWHHFQMSSG